MKETDDTYNTVAQLKGVIDVKLSEMLLGAPKKRELCKRYILQYMHMVLVLVTKY